MDRQRHQFQAALVRPADPGDEPGWAFAVLPKEVSAALPRRGRTSVECTLQGQAFEVTLEPDGRLSHWLRVPAEVLQRTGAEPGTTQSFEICPLADEPEPRLPADLDTALKAAPDALDGWTATTTIARVDWVHWVESAKQAKTRAKRIRDACDQLAAGKRRVCCFDSSGFYSKALSAPAEAE